MGLHRRVSKRIRPRIKRPRFSTERGATHYARSNGWPITEHITTPRGVRLQVVTAHGPRTLRVKQPTPNPVRGGE